MLLLSLLIICGLIGGGIVLGGSALLLAYLKRAQKLRRAREHARAREAQRTMQKEIKNIRKQKRRGAYEPAPDVRIKIPLCGKLLERMINR